MRGTSTLVGVFVLAVLGSGCKKSEAATAQGQELFVNTCARCHGVNGGGGQPAYQGGPAPRNFRDPDFQRARTDEQLKMTIKSGKGAGMPSFGIMFDDAQLAALVAQVRSFDPEKKGTGK